MVLEKIYDKVKKGLRINRKEALFILENGELLDLGELANGIRFKKNPKPWVTFIIDTNPNYTNICNVGCDFCAFHRRKNEEGAYLLTIDQLIQKFKESATAGVTSILLQGGVNYEVPFGYYLELVERTIKEVPGVYPHFFSPPEIISMSKNSGFTVKEVLQKLWEKGLRSIPGGGAEVLSNSVRNKISRNKCSSEDWLNVMKTAHQIGYKTTATMMYGHIEKNEDIVEHLDAIRKLQDETNGFTAFIPWSFKPQNTKLEKVIPHSASPIRYLQIIAFSRIYLDNFQHIQASWFSEGKKIGQIALHFGADDFGGTLLEENVHAAANYINITNVEDCKHLIREAGFIPVQRTTLYDVLKIDDRANAA